MKKFILYHKVDNRILMYSSAEIGFNSKMLDMQEINMKKSDIDNFNKGMTGYFRNGKIEFEESVSVDKEKKKENIAKALKEYDKATNNDNKLKAIRELLNNL